tara:strand:- start:130 stop:363 length:234 start_codon:yes stop_codon:yes gene_type:complete
MSVIREQILSAVRDHAKGNIAIHKTNVEIYLKNPAGIGEHSDITESVVNEIEKIARWQDVLHIVEEHFEDDKRYFDR